MQFKVRVERYQTWRRRVQNSKRVVARRYEHSADDLKSATGGMVALQEILSSEWRGMDLSSVDCRVTTSATACHKTSSQFGL